MFVAQNGNLQLGADAVGGRDKHRVRILVIVNCKEAAEAADIRQHSPTKGRRNHRLDKRYKIIGLINIYTGFCVSGCFFRCH